MTEVKLPPSRKELETKLHNLKMASADLQYNKAVSEAHLLQVNQERLATEQALQKLNETPEPVVMTPAEVEGTLGKEVSNVIKEAEIVPAGI